MMQAKMYSLGDSVKRYDIQETCNFFEFFHGFERGRVFSDIQTGNLMKYCAQVCASMHSTTRNAQSVTVFFWDDDNRMIMAFEVTITKTKTHKQQQIFPEVV